ncbi:hypothetical protein F5Y13DRAFT_88807 [Hypoxylon sp. FL1857]|nr:hypothetical protein F5Y13DRAFT_88807 [Hypoxylon sp. FL1857]
MASKHGWKIELIPWDYSNPEHVQRLYDQRVACGWRADEVPSWVDAAKKGGRMFYWALFSDALPDREKLIKQHIEAYPKESIPLRDTAAEIRLVPRQPTMAEFIPIGHVAVDVHTPEDDMKLGLPPTGTVWVHGLYISRALHGGGFGAGTMSKIETLVTESPMNAKIVALDTISKDLQTEPGKRDLLYYDGGIPVPRVASEDWYTSLGYELFKREENVFVSMAKGGVEMPSKYLHLKILYVLLCFHTLDLYYHPSFVLTESHRLAD